MRLDVDEAQTPSVNRTQSRAQHNPTDRFRVTTQVMAASVGESFQRATKDSRELFIEIVSFVENSKKYADGKLQGTRQLTEIQFRFCFLDMRHRNC